MIDIETYQSRKETLGVGVLKPRGPRLKPRVESCTRKSKGDLFKLMSYDPFLSTIGNLIDDARDYYFMLSMFIKFNYCCSPDFTNQINGCLDRR